MRGPNPKPELAWSWDDLRFFLATVEAGSVTKAGARLGVNHSTVSRRLAALEDALEVRLFERHPDGVQLTAAGHRILETCREMEAKSHDVARLIRAGDKRLAGHVKIAASTAVADAFIAPRLQEFMERYPDIRLDLDLDVRAHDLMRREADIAVRLKPVTEAHQGASILTRKLGTFAWGLYAAPDSVGDAPLTEDTLRGREFIGIPEDYPVRPGADYIETLGLKTTLAMTSMVSIARAVSMGLGLGFIPCMLGRQYGLVQVVPPRDRSELWLLVHPELKENAAVRATLDFFAEIDDETRAAMAGRD